MDKYHSRDVFHALYSSRLPGSQLGKPYKKKLGRADKYMTSSLERKISIWLALKHQHDLWKQQVWSFSLSRTFDLFFFFWERGYGLAADRLGEIYLGIDMHTHRSLDEISPVALTCTTIHGGNSDRLIGSWSQSRCTHKLSVEASKCMQVKARAMDI